MILYIIRHAIAVEAGDPRFEQDSQRPLTPRGKERMKKIARALWELEIRLDRILSSPYKRAVQTMRILGRQFGLKKDELILTEHLEPNGYPDRLIAWLAGTGAGADNVALVGHEPYLSQLISVLVSGEADLAVTLKKGGVCRLSVESLRYGRCAQLDWLLSPAQLVEISGDE